MFTDLETKNKFGIDKLELMIEFMGIMTVGDNPLDDISDQKIEALLLKLKTFLEQKIKRDFTSKEYIDLMEGLVNYTASDPGTNERINSLEYLFNLDFIE